LEVPAKSFPVVLPNFVSEKKVGKFEQILIYEQRKSYEQNF
jgi:hypothetical protein